MFKEGVKVCIKDFWKDLVENENSIDWKELFVHPADYDILKSTIINILFYKQQMEEEQIIECNE